jgi:hypothetical protein
LPNCSSRSICPDRRCRRIEVAEGLAVQVALGRRGRAGRVTSLGVVPVPHLGQPAGARREHVERVLRMWSLMVDRRMVRTERAAAPSPRTRTAPQVQPATVGGHHSADAVPRVLGLTARHDDRRDWTKSTSSETGPGPAPIPQVHRGGDGRLMYGAQSWGSLIRAVRRTGSQRRGGCLICGVTSITWPSTPLTNAGDSSVDSSLASSTPRRRPPARGRPRVQQFPHRNPLDGRSTAGAGPESSLQVRGDQVVPCAACSGDAVTPPSRCTGSAVRCRLGCATSISGPRRPRPR